jgi:lipopolysaccharide transport system permease protein
VHAIIVWHQYPQLKELVALAAAASVSLLASRLLLKRLQSELRNML